MKVATKGLRKWSANGGGNRTVSGDLSIETSLLSTPRKNASHCQKKDTERNGSERERKGERETEREKEREREREKEREREREREGVGKKCKREGQREWERPTYK